jgi:Protein kinase domain/Inner membrane component of T3SS, cytoplasmic domain
MPWRLMVVDGADADRYFPLPDNGTRVIGNSHKYSDICLNDLLMARVHCQVDVEDGQVKVTALADDKDTLVNGQKVKESALQSGEVLRVGNSHLRLEPDVPEEEITEFEEVDGFEEVDDGNDTVEVVAVDGEEPVEVEAVEAVEAEPVEAVAVEVEAVEPDPPPSLDWKNLHKLSGHTLAHFEIGPVLGRGHYGVVFRARDTDARREVALKVIGPDFPVKPEELKQFARTIRVIAEIQEDHLVRWWAAGRTAKYVWISQELVEGESLAEFMKKPEPHSKVRWRNALKLGIDIATALDCLCKRKVIHGDLTPANVIIGLDRTAKLNDLMFENALRGSSWYDAQLEQKLLAELPYLPPERLEERAYLNEVSDIYSLGALVYLRLTGRPPFEGATPNQIIDKIQSGQFEKPKKIIKECPMDFQVVIMKMLAHDQEERYQQPAELLNALESIQAMPTL